MVYGVWIIMIIVISGGLMTQLPVVYVRQTRVGKILFF